MGAEGRQARGSRSDARSDSATTGGTAASSTRSIRAASPTRDGDGVGDLPGIIDHLDHLGRTGLGVDAIWLSPIYPVAGSRRRLRRQRPQRRSIRCFGTEADFDRLVAEAHRRGHPRIVLDLVMNHTSDQHPWFQAIARVARRARTPTGTCGATRPAWTRAAARCRRTTGCRASVGSALALRPAARPVLHAHVPRRAAGADWREPDVEAAQFEMVRGWLERGVDGFRLDVFNVFLKHPELPSNPSRRGRTAWDRQDHELRPRPARLARAASTRFRAIVDEAPGPRCRSGSCSPARPRARPRCRPIATSCSTGSCSTPTLVRRGLPAPRSRRRERAFGPDRWPTVVLSNHDQPRHAIAARRLGRGIDRPAMRSRKAAAVVLLTLRGTPFLYYGEELGHARRRRCRPTRSSTRPARPGRPATSRGGTARPMPIADAMDRRARARVHAGHARGCASATTSSDAQRRDPGRRSPTRCCRRYRRLMAARRRAPGDPGPGRCAVCDDRARRRWPTARDRPDGALLVRRSNFADRDEPAAVSRPRRAAAGARWPARTATSPSARRTVGSRRCGRSRRSSSVADPRTARRPALGGPATMHARS